MKLLGQMLMIAVVLLVMALPSFAQAWVLEWDRNADTEGVGSYQVYSCLTKGCVDTALIKVPGAIIQQPAVAIAPALQVNPSWAIPANTEGRLAITAIDVAGNESLMSVSLPFDAIGPTTAKNLRLRRQ